MDKFLFCYLNKRYAYKLEEKKHRDIYLNIKQIYSSFETHNHIHTHTLSLSKQIYYYYNYKQNNYILNKLDRYIFFFVQPYFFHHHHHRLVDVVVVVVQLSIVCKKFITPSSEIFFFSFYLIRSGVIVYSREKRKPSIFISRQIQRERE